jgi:hypothetical protein
MCWLHHLLQQLLLYVLMPLPWLTALSSAAAAAAAAGLQARRTAS